MSQAEDAPSESEVYPTSSSELSTPAILVDRRRLQRNIDAMAARVQAAGAELWPHVKTHKSSHIADLQLEAGAIGLTAATVVEAEMLAERGIRNILLAYPPVGGWRLDRITELAGRCSLTVACDRTETVLELDDACRDAGVAVDYLWEVDCGLHRCGTEPGRATVELICEVAPRTRHATFSGLMTFPGHAYGAVSSAELVAIAWQELDAIRMTADLLASRGIDTPVLSIGSTPTLHHLPGGVRGMVVRPGNYVFYDATQVALGVVEQESCALSVLSTVISRVSSDRLVLDCGSKALSTDRMTERSSGYGIVSGHLNLTVTKLFEEHAIVQGDAGHIGVGDRVRVIPNHACAVTNLHQHLHIVDGDRIIDRWPVDAHGWTRSGS